MPPPTARSRRCRSMPAFARQNGWPPSASPIMPAAWASGGAPSCRWTVRRGYPALDPRRRLRCARQSRRPLPAAGGSRAGAGGGGLHGRDFVFDVQTHLVNPVGGWRQRANPARLGRRPRRPGGNRPDRPPQACRQRRSEFCCLWSAHANRVRRMAARTRRQAGLAAENSRWTASLVSIRAWELPLSGGMRFWRDIG
jgi:hypothetical protein